jgi:hypothetical protein
MNNGTSFASEILMIRLPSENGKTQSGFGELLFQ